MYARVFVGYCWAVVFVKDENGNEFTKGCYNKEDCFAWIKQEWPSCEVIRVMRAFDETTCDLLTRRVRDFFGDYP